MVDAKVLKRLKITEVHLEQARRALPEPTEAHKKEYATLLARYHEFLEHNEFELALDMLEELGRLIPCRGGFWRDLERAADNMDLVDRLPALRKEFCDALERLGA